MALNIGSVSGPSILHKRKPEKELPPKEAATRRKVAQVKAAALQPQRPEAMVKKLTVGLFDTYQRINLRYFSDKADKVYDEKLKHHGVGSPLKNPNGKERKGTYKRAAKTGSPEEIALLSSPHKTKKPEAYMRIAKREAELLDALKGCSHIPEQVAHFGSEKRYASIQKNVGPDLYETYLDTSNPAMEKLTMSDLERIAKQLLEATQYLHQKGMLHGDIKPENCSKKGCLFDFGLSAPPGTKNLLYSRFYRPLETVLKLPTGLTADVWALGCLFYELYTKEPLIPISPVNDNETQADIDMIHAYADRLNLRLNPDAIGRTYPDMVESSPAGKVLKASTRPRLVPFRQEVLKSAKGPRREQFVDLLSKMLQINPKDRISAQEALAHPFFTSNSSTDVSFKLAVTQSKPMHMRILNHRGNLIETINLAAWRPYSCYHIQASSKPYTFEFYDPAQPDITHKCTASIRRDRETIEINTDTFSVKTETDAPAAVESSSSSSSEANVNRQLF